jgi:ribosomal protein S18 acetylase RimI-like enzyme
MRQLERVQVRLATLRDLPRLVEAWGELARYHERFDPGFALSRGWRQSYAAYVASLLGRGDVCVVVAWVPGELAGMAVGRTMLAPPFFRYRRRGYIQDVYTREPYRRQGIARRMVERLEAWMRAQGVRRVELTVAPQNPTALAFWEGMGYRPYLQVFSKAL